VDVKDDDIVDDVPAVLLGAYFYSLGLELYDDRLDPLPEENE
jgi:hypothetical protein